jgi:hypothetical protein
VKNWEATRSRFRDHRYSADIWDGYVKVVSAWLEWKQSPGVKES